MSTRRASILIRWAPLVRPKSSISSGRARTILQHRSPNVTGQTASASCAALALPCIAAQSRLQQPFSVQQEAFASPLFAIAGGLAALFGACITHHAQADAASAATDGPKLASKAETLYEQHAHPKEIYDLLKPHASLEDAHADVLWRFARAARDLSQETPDKHGKKDLVYEAFEASKRAVEKDDNSFAANKWYAIMLSAIGDYEGSKKAILDAFLIEKHFKRAIELNPNDPTSHHLLGRWCWTFADMPWYQKKAAGAIFATPPKATYEDALQHFQAAEELDPDFYTQNSLFLAKCHLALGNKEEAKKWKEKCLNIPAKNADDRQAHEEANKLRI